MVREMVRLVFVAIAFYGFAGAMVTGDWHYLVLAFSAYAFWKAGE